MTTSSAERALLLAAGEVPVGGWDTKCTVETDGAIIGVVAKTGKRQKTLMLPGVEALRSLVAAGQAFLDIFDNQK